MTRPQLKLRQTARHAAAFAFIACAPLHGGAQSDISRTEAAQMYTAAGFVIANDRPVNRCGQPVKPRVTFVDLNADKRPEALFVDEDVRCYAPAGRYFAVLVKEGNRWRAAISGNGSIQAQPTRTAGWLDMRVNDAGCTRNFSFTGRAYASAGGCAGETLAAASPAPPARAKATAPGTEAPPTTAATRRHATRRPGCHCRATGRRRERRLQGGWLKEARQRLAKRLRRPGNGQLLAGPHRSGR